ncbi:MAG TPA: hypothetical protein VLY04_21460 [Bryobacteraceae bacterium]|nr:hypothetical protein [Bryobacteraceae bacterium]
MSPSRTLPGRLLLLAAAGNFAVALLHLVLAFAGENTNRFFGAPPWVLDLFQQERALLVVLVLAMTALFTLFGLYDVSGAGGFRHLPLLRTVLVAVGVIYTLRGLELPLDIVAALNRPAFGRQFILFSAVALLIGIASLAGTLGRWRDFTARPARRLEI